MKIGIAGAGLIGRLLALECLERGWDVTLFDSDERNGQKSCGWVAAGMIAPYTELESSEPLLLSLGLEALTLWPKILQRLIEPVSFHRKGTLVVAHPQDLNELKRFQTILDYKLFKKKPLAEIKNKEAIFKNLSREQLETLAPDLSSTIREGIWLPDEGDINSVEFFLAAARTLIARDVHWHEKTHVKAITAHQIQTDNNKYSFDLVCDCRGLGAKQDWTGLRGVRGELIWLQTAEVNLHCPVRLLHPRYPIYISPRADDIYVVGATTIESEDMSPISAQSMLELLSAAYTIHPGFAEARIVKTLTQCRPAFRDHQPKISLSEGLLKINGFYRHGYMAGPAVIQDVMRLLEKGKNALKFPELMIDTEETSLCKSL